MKSSLIFGAALLGALSLAACSGSGGGGGSGGAAGFQLSRISLQDGAIWELNREIEFSFTDVVDFASVSSNTINIQSSSGAPATGSFFYKPIDTDGDGVPDDVDERVIIFQPTCPTKADLSDAGLQAGGVSYLLRVIGESSNAVNTVRSQRGVRLSATQSRSFSTPVSTSPATAFLDTTIGPPVPVVRTTGSTTENGITYVEIGGDPDPTTRIFFEFNPLTQSFSIQPGANAPSEAPLNLYSEQASAVSVLIEFNQAVNPASSNISPSRLRLEFQDTGGVWQPLETAVELVANCTQIGATVKLTPIGVLPAGSQFRAVVLPGFQDIVGDANLLSLSNFAVSPTQALAYVSLNPADDGADEFIEQFLVGGNSPGSFQDTGALFDSPEAEWSGDRLKAAFTFEGTGGPGGDFDWVVKAGETLFFDTTATSIIGGPGGVPTAIQNTNNGVADVRDFIIEAGGEVRVQGPNQFQVNASGDVRISGLLDLGGFNAKDVATLNTGNQAEVGGAGSSGGGRGGNASEVLTGSTPRGGRGQGPFGQKNTGGQGGESGFAPANMGKDARRPGGGGGGRFAPDQGNFFAEPGYPGMPESRGAESGVSPAAGGFPGLGPFTDGDDTNDFFGTQPVVSGGILVDLIRGELPQAWAGYGGGGGGDALPSNKFPTKRWNPGSDEKGGGGGGGGGSARIKALGRIIFGPTGRISCRGGKGATGENTIFLDHVGGTGGSGSGGHVILETATNIDFTDEGNNVAANTRRWVDAVGGPTVVGPGGNQGGSMVPTEISWGGQGGPGVVQFHVPDPISPPSDDPSMTDIIVPTAALASATPLDGVSAPTGMAMIPTFGARSQARSKWISIGGADDKQGGGINPVQFLFEGTDPLVGPDEGKIITTGTQVDELPQLLGPDPVPSAVATLSDPLTIQLVGSALDSMRLGGGTFDDIYLRTPALLENFVVRLSETLTPSVFQDFVIVDASYDDNLIALRLAVDGTSGTMQDFIDFNGPFIDYELIPRFFTVTTEGVQSFMPTDSFVRIEFQGTGDDGMGNPDEGNILVDWTGDISMFNALNPGELQFFRFEVEFDLDSAGTGVTVDTKPVELGFLRIPFRF